jgi:hypothetical protein
MTRDPRRWVRSPADHPATRSVAEHMGPRVLYRDRHPGMQWSIGAHELIEISDDQLVDLPTGRVFV